MTVLRIAGQIVAVWSAASCVLALVWVGLCTRKPKPPAKVIQIRRGKRA